MYHPQSASAKLSGQSQSSSVENTRQQAVSLPGRVLHISNTKKNVHIKSQVLGVAALNTHFFDGKIGDSISHIRTEIDRVREIPVSSKITAFGVLLEKIHTMRNIKLTPGALRCFNAIASDFNGNYDPANYLHADDLLYLLYEKIVCEDSYEHASLLAEQLDEMVSGMCPQGRTTRLLQILIMLKDDLTPTSKPRGGNALASDSCTDSEVNEVVIHSPSRINI